MPSRSKESVALYHDKQVKAWQKAQERWLSNQPGDNSEYSKGEVLAGIARSYVASNNSEQTETTTQHTDTSLPWGFILGAIFILFVVFVLFVGVMLVTGILPPS